MSQIPIVRKRERKRERERVGGNELPISITNNKTSKIRSIVQKRERGEEMNCRLVLPIVIRIKRDEEGKELNKMNTNESGSTITTFTTTIIICST